MKIWKLERTAVISPETAKSLKMDVQLPTDDVFRRAIENTKGAQITDDGLEIEITRNQHPDQSERDSIRSGVFYQPEGSPSKYPYSGKQGYGGIEKIKGKTLLRRPVFVKGATGGKAPEMAYDLIKGKGAYHQMRSEVLDLTMSYVLRRNDPDAIRNLLQKHGGDPSLADEIAYVFRVNKGNGLAYAIQENIVANNVRKAGYDSVVGWSLRRDGSPFISEIFDVREVSYPSRANPEGRVHEELLQVV